MTFEELTAPLRKPIKTIAAASSFDWRHIDKNDTLTANIVKSNRNNISTLSHSTSGDSMMTMADTNAGKHRMQQLLQANNLMMSHNNNQHQHPKQSLHGFRNAGSFSDACKDNYFVQALSETTMAFCQETTLHGMKYVVQDIQELGSTYSRQRRFRKLISLTIWSGACIMGAVFAVVLMRLVWDRFQTTPTITTVETNNYPIWNVNFPAVTICNINKVYAPATRNIIEKLMQKGIARESVIEFLENLAKLITPEYIDALFLKTYQHLEEMGYTTDRLMFELMQPCGNMIKSCAWLGKTVSCDTLFRVAKSAEGFCCSFNYKALKDSLEINTASNTVNDQLNNPIYRVTGSGENVGLNIRIDIEKDEYVAYSKSFYGAKVLVHDAGDFPQTSVTTTVAQPGFDVTVAVVPSVIISEPGIRSLSQHQRNCLFEDEMRLRTTNKYTFQSCMNECTVDTILSKCDCIPFYYPESDIRVFAKRYRQCSLHDVKCLRDNRHVFSSLQPPNNIEALNETNPGMMCTCLPSCSELRYEVQTILSKRYSDDRLNSTSINDNVPDLDKATTLKVHFKELTCIKYRRDMYMTWDGLLAAFGGIFGLCLGGSVLSLVEMAYYFTLRLYNRMHSLWRQNDGYPATRPSTSKAIVAPARSRRPSMVTATTAAHNPSSRLLLAPAFVANSKQPAGIILSKLQSFDERKGGVELGLGVGPTIKGRGPHSNVYSTINERSNVGHFLR